MRLSKVEQARLEGSTSQPSLHTITRSYPQKGNSGRKNGSAKLTEEKVRHIRANGIGEYKQNPDGMSDAELGRYHGVHAQTIKYVRTFATWSDV